MLVTLFLTYFFASFFTLALAGRTTTHGRRGVARIMDFGGSDNLEKRDRGTWYNGIDLKNAACFGRNGLNPFNAKVQDMIGAMAMHDFEQCYKCMQITNNRQKDLQIIVSIVDKCAACKVGTAIDLTPAAFKLLSPSGDLSSGVLDISFKPVKCPANGLLPDLPDITKLLL